MTEEELRGRTVLSGDGLAIGEISRLLIDAPDLRITAIQVKLRKGIAERLGESHSRFHAATLDISTQHVQSVGDAVILSVPVDQLKAPEPAAASADASPPEPAREPVQEPGRANSAGVRPSPPRPPA